MSILGLVLWEVSCQTDKIDTRGHLCTAAQPTIPKLGGLKQQLVIIVSHDSVDRNSDRARSEELSFAS